MNMSEEQPQTMQETNGHTDEANGLQHKTEMQADSAEGLEETGESDTVPNQGTFRQEFRPLNRMERRSLWIKEYGEQDFALQMWVRLVEQQDLEIEMMLQTHGMLIFGVMVSTMRYAQFYIDLNEELHRQQEPDTADALRNYYMALVPSPEEPEIGPEGLPVLFRYIHMRDVTIMSSGHKVKVPYWRGKIDSIDAFVIGATAGD